jgi:ABC-2 type transport system ATP-binding protein
VAPQSESTSGVRVEVAKASKVIEPVTLLAPISLTAKPGRCIVLRGPNGAGKTTLLRLVAGLTAASSGKVTLDGEPADERNATTRQAVAALIGAPATYRDLTLADHLTLIDATWGRDVDTCEMRVAEGLALFGIGHLAQRFPHELSSGQGQLFRLALTWFRPSRLMVLDEPEQRLDTDRRGLIARLITERCDAGVTVLMACHDPAITEAVADGVVDVTGAQA